MKDTILLSALEHELDRVISEMELTVDEIAVVYEDYPESHVFYPGESYDPYDDDDREVVNLVMSKDVHVKNQWLADRIEKLQEDGVRDEGGFLHGCEGMCDMLAEMAAERRMGC